MTKPVERIDYFANGSIKARGHELDGALHGAWEWFRQDGSLLRTGEFDRGEQIGSWCTYTRDGKLHKETIMRSRA